MLKAYPSSESAVDSSSLLCRVQSRYCAIPLAQVVETMRPLPIVPFADMPPFVLGVSLIRGAPTPVVALSRLLGVTEDAEATRFVTVRAGDRTVALAVETVIGVRVLSDMPTAELPPLLAEATAEIVATIGRLDSELLVVLRGVRWVPEPEWPADAGEGTAG
jgi:purine-binding chemotaxis protein CheW